MRPDTAQRFLLGGYSYAGGTSERPLAARLRGASKVCAVWAVGPHRAFAANLSKSNTTSPCRDALACRGARSTPRSNCDDTVSKMILRDSFGTKFGNPPGSASNRGSIATKWNRLESLPTLTLPSLTARRARRPRQPDRSTRSSRGASNPWSTLGALPHRGHREIFRDSFFGKFSGGWGASKVCGLRGRLPHGVPRADFFWRGQTFDYFLEIKDFKRRPRSPSGSIASLFNGLRPACVRHRQHGRVGEANIFSGTPKPPGGISKFSPIARTTAWQAHAFFREIPETFFGRRGARKNAAKFRVEGVGRTALR